MSVCLSVCLFVHLSVLVCVRKLVPYPAVLSQNATTKTCLKVKNINLSPLGSVLQGEAKVRILNLTSVFHHLLSTGSKQLCASAHLGCSREAVPLYPSKLKKTNSKSKYSV